MCSGCDRADAVLERLLPIVTAAGKGATIEEAKALWVRLLIAQFGWMVGTMYECGPDIPGELFAEVGEAFTEGMKVHRARINAGARGNVH